MTNKFSAEDGSEEKRVTQTLDKESASLTLIACSMIDSVREVTAKIIEHGPQWLETLHSVGLL